MAKFLILVTSPHYDSDSAKSSYEFAKAAIEQNHEVLGIFFYQSGVSHANQFNAPLSDEPSASSLWQELATRYKVNLLVCATAASRRGIADKEEAKRMTFNGDNLSEHFTMSGLTEFSALSTQATRVVQF
ncbi:sulfurtransferase complex subunit TusD [Paraneptunicella aestuarii]|uniref:sulfurtransferase complex subunit TusD n=1 Tax=Paraneptunicella aestuarii TaxID=2831148 RepID=UPI001E3804B6|nr:sulfurtransferase complex subunit TusD [Paraneptunicella aestuarii]UAA37297.1 sulfurtransferase complex subunit TusD [Paraneptunicella aestuarii]